MYGLNIFLFKYNIYFWSRRIVYISHALGMFLYLSFDGTCETLLKTLYFNVLLFLELLSISFLYLRSELDENDMIQTDSWQNLLFLGKWLYRQWASCYLWYADTERVA